MATPESVKHSFCPIPWIHTSMDSIGNLRLCCMANLAPFSYFRKEDQTRYNAEFDLLPRNHEYSKFVRSEMLKGNKSDMCRQCWVLEDAGLNSNRMSALEHSYPDEIYRAVELTEEDGTIDPKDFPIRYYDLRLGNKCNSRCIICNSENSSMWGRLVDWSHGILETPYLKHLMKNSSTIDRMYFTGGEPMIGKNHWQLLDFFIEEGHAGHIALDYNSNGVVMTKNILDKWKHFKSVGVGFSVDGIGEVYEKIRIPSKWKTIEKNLQLFDDYGHSNTCASFAMTVLSLNILNIIDLFKWYYKKNFKRIYTNPHFNILSRPLDMDIRRIPLEQKHIIKKEYDKFYNWVDENCNEDEYIINAIKTNFSGVINTMYMEPFDKK